MLTKRIIACLDVDDGRVVKGVQFVNLRDAGDPAQLAKRHSESGADEIVLLDISAAHQRRATLLDTVRRTAKEIFIPFTVGGGIRTLPEAAAVFSAGADKISINSSALADPTLITQIAERFGSQAVVVAIDAKRHNGSWQAFTHGGRVSSDRDAVEWALEAESRGAGEILLTSMPYLPGPMFWNSDLSVMKNIRITEHQNLQFRVSAFNFMNHALTSFTNGDNNLKLTFDSNGNANPDFGKATYKVGRRIVELGVKYSF